MRYTPDGRPICSFSLATKETWKDASGVKQEETEWHRVVIFGKLAEVAWQYLSKGKPVYLEGRNKTNSWEKDGQKHYSTDVICNVMQFLPSPGNGGNREERGNEGGGSREDDDL